MHFFGSCLDSAGEEGIKMSSGSFAPPGEEGRSSGTLSQELRDGEWNTEGCLCRQ